MLVCILCGLIKIQVGLCSFCLAWLESRLASAASIPYEQQQWSRFLDRKFSSLAFKHDVMLIIMMAIIIRGDTMIMMIRPVSDDETRAYF